MRRILATITVLVACLLGLPATAPGDAAPAPAPLGGGSQLFTLGGPPGCFASFAATSGTTGFLIAGRSCAASPGTLLYSGANVLVGPVASSSNGITLIEVTNTTDWELVGWLPVGGDRIVIRGSAETPLGGSVCLLSHTSGLVCGTVTGLNQTINFPEGPITGLTRTNICLDPRGFAFVSGDQAQGVPIGGSGNCSGGATSFFMPINPILNAYGLTLIFG